MQYMDEILLSLKPRLKRCHPHISISGPDQLLLDSYPGSYYQIFTNLILNSLLHGFENQPGGNISITIRQEQHRVIIDYRDDGTGVPDGWHQKLFEPFMTTKRNQGCSGLGMHIAFNIVSQLLKGHIDSLPAERARISALICRWKSVIRTLTDQSNPLRGSSVPPRMHGAASGAVTICLISSPVNAGCIR